MARASCILLVIMHSFKEHGEEITFSKDLLAVSLQICSISVRSFGFGVFLRRGEKIKDWKENPQYKIPQQLKGPITFSVCPSAWR